MVTGTAANIDNSSTQNVTISKYYHRKEELAH
jgi:hypothetical protein